MTPPASSVSLLRDRNVRLLWASSAVSQAGSTLTGMALPLTAVLVLHATAGQMGALTVAESAPGAALLLFGGVWADRLQRRRLLVWSDVVAAVLIGSIPLAARADALTFGWLVAVVVVFGAMGAFVGPAASAFIPEVILPDALDRANRLFHSTGGILNVAMPPVAGALIRAIGAPYVMAVDAASFLISGGLVARIPANPAPTAERRSIRHEMVEGLAELRRDPILRASAACYAAWGFAGYGIVMTLYFLYLSRTLGMSALAIGLVTAVGGAAMLAATALAPRLRSRFGLGATLVLAAGILAASPVFLALATPSTAFPVAAAAAACSWGGYFLLNVNLVTIRQTIVDGRLLGRVSAGLQFLLAVAVPLGAIVAGTLGEAIGVRPTIWVGAAIQLLVPIVLVTSPLRTLRDLPARTDPEPAA
jgi:MFS family permease